MSGVGGGALRLHPRPSPMAAGLSLLLFTLLVVALHWASLPSWARWPALLVATLGCAHLLFSHGLRRGPFAVVCVEWLGAGRWRLTDGRGRRLEARRLAGGVVHHRLVAVPFAVGWERYSLILFADAADADAVRGLRSRLLGD